MNEMQMQQKFWARVDCPKLDNGLPDWDIIDSNECMMWIGHPIFICGGMDKNMSVQKFIGIYILKQDFSNGKKAYRTCFNTQCANPNHVKVGTQSEMQKLGYKTGNRKIVALSGEDNPNSIFDKKQIHEICEKYRNGMNTYELAEEYDVARITISKHLKDNGIEMRMAGLDSLKIENIELFKIGKKKCSVCKKVKIIEGNFNKHKMGQNGLSASCRNCRTTYAMMRRKTDEMTAFICKVRGTVKNGFTRKGFKKDSLTEKLLQTDFKTAWNRITENGTIKLKGNHVDHIVPLKIAGTKQEVEILCHYTNLRIISKEANLKKGSKLPSIDELPDDICPKVRALYDQVLNN